MNVSHRFLLLAVTLSASFGAGLVACGDDEPAAAAGGDAGSDGALGTDAVATDDAATDSGNVDLDGGMDAPLGPLVPPVACGAVLPGPPLAANVTEALPGYATDLAAVDTTTLPAALDLSTESVIGRGVVRYALLAGSDVHAKSALLVDKKLGAAVLGAIARDGDAGTSLDLPFMRRGLHYFYPCSRPLPATLDALRARYGDYTKWTTFDITCSAPKNGPRRIHESASAGVYVAETLVDGKVRETEVIFSKLRTDDQLDFAAYTETGALTDRSTFATASSSVTSAAPYTCMTCHLDVATGRFTRLFPTGTGAGCK